MVGRSSVTPARNLPTSQSSENRCIGPARISDRGSLRAALEVAGPRRETGVSTSSWMLETSCTCTGSERLVAVGGVIVSGKPFVWEGESGVEDEVGVEGGGVSEAVGVDGFEFGGGGEGDAAFGGDAAGPVDEWGWVVLPPVVDGVG